MLILLVAAPGCGSAEPPPQPEPLGPIETQVTEVDSGGLALHVRVTTSDENAPVLVVASGGPALSHDYVEPLEALASARFRVVTYDQRGTGASEGPDPAETTAFGFDDHVADLEAIRRALGVERVHLLGHSFGAALAAAYVVEHPERVSSIALANPSPPYLNWVFPSLQVLYERIGQLQAEGLIPAELPEDCTERFQTTLPAYFADPRTPVPPPLAATRCPDEATTNAWNVELTKGFDFREGLASVSVPVLG